MTREEAIEVLKKKAEYFESDKRFKVAVETLIPELAESEDERIRKQLIDAIKIGRSNSGISFTEEAASRYIAWLEKHSEEEIRKIRNEEHTNGFNDAAGFEKQKEQKPADLSDMMVHKEPYIAPVPTPMVADERKPAEWSDTKELVFKDICNHLKEEGYSGWVLLLNALRNGEFQPKLAWSKKDKKIIDTIVSVLGQYIDYKAVSGTGSGYATPRYSKEIDWLNSLSLNLKKKNEDVAKLCSNEWSEEDEKIWNHIIDCAESRAWIPFNEISWLVAHKPQFHWKPSEEQMEALKCAILDVARFSKRGGRQVELENEPYYSALHSLYCNLEKLM